MIYRCLSYHSNRLILWVLNFRHIPKYSAWNMRNVAKMRNSGGLDHGLSTASTTKNRELLVAFGNVYPIGLHTLNMVDFTYISGWSFQPTPLKNDGVRQLGWWNSQLNGKIKFMLQTTNRICVGEILVIVLLLSVICLPIPRDVELGWST